MSLKTSERVHEEGMGDIQFAKEFLLSTGKNGEVFVR